MLITTELSEKIKASEIDFSRAKFEEFTTNRNLVLRGKCNPNCIKHSHGVIMVASRTNSLENMSDVVISQGLPLLKVIKEALAGLQRFEVNINFQNIISERFLF